MMIQAHSMFYHERVEEGRKPDLRYYGEGGDLFEAPKYCGF